MKLLVDIGNSRLKWAWAKDGRIHTGPALVNEYINPAALRDIWQSLPSPDVLVVSCVSAGCLHDQVHAIAIELWPGISKVKVVSLPDAFGVKNFYQQPEKLGVDRWLSLIAARKHYDGPVCVADCGTAITIDLLDACGFHQGGLIAPGLTLMKDSLVQGTHALQWNGMPQRFGLADNTEAAIYSGTLAACCGLIEHALSGPLPHFRLILTGGDATLIAEHLTIPSIVDHELVLRGLLRVAEET